MALDNSWLKELIESMGLPCAVSLLAGTDKTCIAVAMGEGPNQEAQQLQILLQPQQIEGEGEEISLLQLYVPICSYTLDHMPAIAGFILQVNGSLDLPGFGLNPVQQCVYYRTSSFITKNSASNLVQTLIGIAFVYIDGFTETIEAISSGQQTTQQAIQKIIEKAKTLAGSDHPS